MEKLVLLDDSHFIIDMMYARTNNMLGRAVYKEIGFSNVAYLHPDAHEKLLSLIPTLEELNLKMRVCDAYRPPLAHQKILEIIPYSKAKLFAKTPAASNHCHGTAVDVCLTDRNGNNLVYPSEIDAYEPKFAKEVQQGKFDSFKKHLITAHHDYMKAPKTAIKNREFLRTLMETHGFESIQDEWWHYNLIGWQDYSMIDWP